MPRMRMNPNLSQETFIEIPLKRPRILLLAVRLTLLMSLELSTHLTANRSPLTPPTQKTCQHEHPNE